MKHAGRQVCVSVAARVSVVLLCGVVAGAQTRNAAPADHSYPSPNGAGGYTSNYDVPAADASIAHHQVLSRREEARRRMLVDAARLVTLTRELQADIHLHEADATDAKRLDEITKLARTVRDQMRQ